ncbi:MAG: hypothetical protein HC778_04415 [Chamaesiphon sp. CSU_1_12]|nr:hypothetical protein [Chamaesiphon sp. CSU_1_12]
MKVIFSLIVTIHGLIHLIGFAKAFGDGNITQLTKEISKPIGTIWLATALSLLVVAVLFVLKKDGWSLLAVITAIVSQILIFTVWQDAKFGTIPNLIIIAVAIFSLGMTNFENAFRQDVRENLLRTNRLPTEMLTEADIKPLPESVRRYLKYVGVINKPKVKNVRIIFNGQMRDRGKDFFPFRSEQYNFFDEPTRLFFMKGKISGLTVPGYHRYSNAKATMDIRLFGLFPIVQQSGTVMDKTETVTLFNDMCLMAPATLIDKRIQWQELDLNSAKATFTNHGITISAILYFNDLGQLIDFRSDDRTATSDMKQYPFFTPVTDYHNINGINIMSHGDAVWGYPDGKFTYGKFLLKNIEYNSVRLR